MKKILIAGGAGFIGSHLSKKLLGQNNKIICLDNFFTGFQSNIDEIKNCKNFEFIKHDIIEPIDIEVDEIYNLACPASPLHYQSDPIFTTKTSVIGTLNLLDMANKYDSKYLFTSTSEVYGTAKYVPIDESHPLQPQSPYSASKIGADAIAMSFYNSFDLPLAVARPFNTFGPRQSARAVIPSIIIQIASKEKNIKVGDLIPTRDFNYVEDTCSGLIGIGESSETNGETINIGSNKEVSINETLDLIKKIMNSDIKIIKDKQRIRPEKSEVFRLWCDNKKITNLTNYKPKYSFEQGLKMTIDWILLPENLIKYKSEIYNV